MPVPDQISTEELQYLAEEAPSQGITPLDAPELRALARKKIRELERIVAELEECRSSTIGGPRWNYFQKARLSIKAAIRNLKRSIAI